MQLTNPTELASCGLPATSSRFTSQSIITTFNLTSVVNGMTCGAIDSPGSIVLMPAG